MMDGIIPPSTRSNKYSGYLYHIVEDWACWIGLHSGKSYIVRAQLLLRELAIVV